MNRMSDRSIAVFLFAIYCSTLPVWASENYIDYDFGWEKIIMKKSHIAVDEYLNTIQLATKYMYSAEGHVVMTTDRYLLGLHRLQNDNAIPQNNGDHKKPVVFLQHGLFSDSQKWLITGPKRSLAYELADKGYDVWLGNTRGNNYSRAHADFLPDNPIFWDFSFDEMGFYDLPAMIDFVLGATGQKQLSYIGHSMGTSMFYAMASSKSEYNDKVQVMVSLAPVAYLSHDGSGIKQGVSIVESISKKHNEKAGEFIPSEDFRVWWVSTGCNYNSATNFICGLFIHDYKKIHDEMKEVDDIVSATQTGTSIRTLLHYIQIYDKDEFEPCNCTHSNNIRYCMKNPDVARYNLSAITVPISLFYGGKDFLMTDKEVGRLCNKLQNIIGMYKIEEFQHTDFTEGTEDQNPVHDTIFEILETPQQSKFLSETTNKCQSVTLTMK